MRERDRAGLLEGARAAAIVSAVAIAALSPGHWVISSLAEGGAAERATLLASGLAADLGLLALPGALIGWLCLGSVRRGGGKTAAFVSLALLAVSLWIFEISSTESRLSRGVFPNWVDVRIMRDSPDMMESSLGMFALPRNLVPSIAAVVMVIAALVAWPKGEGRSRASGAGAAGAGLLLCAVGLLAGLVREPRPTALALLGPRAWGEAWTCLTTACEPRVHIDAASEALDDVSRGAGILGWPPLTRSYRAEHPFARALPAEEIGVVAATGGAPAGAAAVIADLDAVSDALTNNRHGPFRVWHIALEGMRGADIHALAPAAPRNLTPFLTSLYEDAERGEPGVLAAHRVWSAGVRTPHGLAALLCGVGTLPYGLALPRDLHEAPLRCLPNLLYDAGFVVGHAYGGSTAFDHIGAFLYSRQSRSLLGAGALSEMPRGAWGATDRAVFRSTVAAVAETQKSSFTFILTLSHHHPFTTPEDLPADVAERALAAFAQATPRADREDERRLVALAYADAALAEFFVLLRASSLSDDSIVIITADHAIPDRPLWAGRPGALAEPAAHAAIPLVIWIAPPLFDRSADPEDARRRAALAQRSLRDAPLSQNDIPTLILALLGQVPAVASLNYHERWHSMGGQATSPWYAPPGPEGTRIHGIHAGTAAYFVDASGSRTAPDEPASLVVSEARARTVTPSLAPAAAALRALSAPR